MIVAEYIAEILEERRVPAVFELVGGMITHLLDAIHVRGKTPIISMRHEQGAAFAAEGCSRISGFPAVAMATSGPGATNLLTGIGSCHFDSTPAVFITGQVNRAEQKRHRAIRQLGFQETDIVSMAEPVTKLSLRIESESEIPAALARAFHTACGGRPGPVLVDIPMDVQRAQIDRPEQWPIFPNEDSEFISSDANRIWGALQSAARPMVLAGGGVRSANALDQFRQFISLAQVPVVHSLMGVDLLAWDDPLNVGMIGSYGNRWANLALSQCDCLVVLGSRLDIRQTGADTAGFKGDRTIFHIDCERGELNNRVENCEVFVSGLGPALALLVKEAQRCDAHIDGSRRSWLLTIAALRAQWPDTEEVKGSDGINPNRFMQQISQTLPETAAWVIDVGQHQMWAAQSLRLSAHQRFLTSGGMGSMGFALPASIGAAIAAQGKPVVMIAGDGGFQCNIQELETASHLQLPIQMVIINNNCHGMVRQFQESYFEQRYYSTVWGYSAPDFVKVARAYDIPSMSVASTDLVPSALQWLAQQSRGPSLLEVQIPQLTNVYPKLAFGRGLESMEPYTLPLDMEST